LEIQSLLRDRYRITRILAQSGMGVVYLAHDEVLNVDLAIKENLYTTEVHSRQFRQEATILAKLRHPNLPRVIDHFVIENVGEYLIMDYIEGQDLSERLASAGGILPKDEVVRIGAVICDALAYLHSRTPPIIHRDIKPANLKITLDGQVVLVDFGLAKIYEQGEMTAIGAKGITAGYSPVEQYGQGTDARSDIYALGATLYTLLTGQVPPEGLERAVGQDPLERVDHFNSEVSPDLQAVVHKAMAIRPEARFNSASSLQEALLEAHPLPDFSPSKPVVPPTVSAAGSPQKGSQDNAGGGRTARRKRAWTWLLPVLILLAGAITGFILLLRHQRSPNILPDPQPSDTRALEVFPVDEAAVEETEPALEAADTQPVLPTMTLTPELEAAVAEDNQWQIAFVSEQSGTPQIYLMNFDGSGIEQLTSEAEGACQPAWAPDGMRLAYISPCEGLKERYDGASLFILDLNTGRVDLISTLATGDYDPAWSPDGNRLAFTSLQTGKPQIFIYDFEAGQADILMNRAIVNRMPAWSPDGSQIAFISVNSVSGRPTLYVVDVEGEGTPRDILGQNYAAAYHPDWSPEGDLILFDLGGKSALGGRLPSINQDASINTGLNLVENPAFSPDAKFIICEGVQGDSGRDIYLMLRTGARLTRLTDDPAADYQPTWRP